MRKIIHIDMDCFFAAVEMRDDPSLKEVPLAIGGSADRRGVIATCNYPARRFGVRSAMATAHALKLCPQLVLLRGRMDKYVEVSKQIRQIFERYTHKIEPLSLDEAYLDVSDSELFGGSATLIAEDIRRRIFAETGLTASAGVAPCKFVAKIASDENKPDGLCVIPPQKLDNFVKTLPLKRIPGVGQVTWEKLQHLGLRTCEDVRCYPFDRLVKQFGKFGPVLWQRAHGQDERLVSNDRQRKSVGVEVTLPEDIRGFEQCWSVIESLYPKLEKRLKAHQQSHAVQTQGIKIKFADFQQTTVEHRHGRLEKAYFKDLLSEALERQAGRGIRLVGLHLALPTETDSQQLPLPLPQVETLAG
ncbi:DNA polymerase IV [Aliiglaciecola sp. CAU 1673]|uniref:DNA polymerase IV n=1 Tax=Aliiglaciecola sp. CAU 1673 TaxID=3032595 RepID=UPI0023DAE9AF|nr:DNA polymerase IV [Aliiglaciecola sp. CAU 1673]MDF2176803.1 DNA polymerase IV [Aliiglaciecola sp. CAU 1673]